MFEIEILALIISIILVVLGCCGSVGSGGVILLGVLFLLGFFWMAVQKSAH